MDLNILILKITTLIRVWKQNNVYIQYISTYRPIARQRLGQRSPAEAKANKNRTSIARQRGCVFSVVRAKGYKEEFRSWQEEYSEKSSFGTPACRDMSFGTQELN
jgi:hypothetical protein